MRELCGILSDEPDHVSKDITIRGDGGASLITVYVNIDSQSHSFLKTGPTHMVHHPLKQVIIKIISNLESLGLILDI